MSRKSIILTAEYENKVVALFDSKVSVIKIAKDLQLPRRQIYKFLKKINKVKCKDMTNVINLKNNIADVINLYCNGCGATHIANIYGCSPQTVLDLLHKNNVAVRTHLGGCLKYSHDKNFFQNIDCEAKSWILGLYYTDGNIYGKCLRLVMTDLDIVEKVKKYLKYDGPITLLKKAKPSHKDRYSLCIFSPELTNQLLVAGCGPNKSFTLKFPSEEILNRDLQKHFIRGLIDGDGWVGKESVGLCGASKMVDEFTKIVNSQINYKTIISDRYMESGNLFYRRFFKALYKVKTFLHWIYDDATIYGDRKFNKVHTWFQKEYRRKFKKERK